MKRRLVIRDIHQVPLTIDGFSFYFGTLPENGWWEIDTVLSLSEKALTGGMIGLRRLGYPEQKLLMSFPKGTQVVIQVMWSPSFGIAVGGHRMLTPESWNNSIMHGEPLDILDSNDANAVFDYVMEMFT